MLEPSSIPIASLGEALHAPVGEVKRRRYFLATVFSAIIPGAGQLLLGQRRKAIALLLILVTLVICFWPLRLPRFYGGFVLLCWAWILLYLYAACNAITARGSDMKELRPSRLWLIVVLPITLFSLGLLGAALARASGFRSFSVPSPSMEKTVLNGDQIVADMDYYRSRSPAREDVIIFQREGSFFVKRVIAIGGDTIQGNGGVVLVNGQAITEPFVQHSSQPENWMVNFGPVTVGAGKFFVMGDNRDISLDSRWQSFGLVDEGSVMGKPLYVLGSSRIGKHVQ